MEAPLVALGALGALALYIRHVADRARGPTMRRILDDMTTVTSPFGPRRHPVTGKQEPHTGTDFRAPTGANVYAPESAVVTRAEWNHPLNGNWVALQAGERSWAFAHLSSIAVAVNESVNAGQLVGLVGNTGRTTGPHLHVGLRVNGTRVDPMTYLRDAK